MPTTLQLRRGTTAENAAFTGAEGELTVDTQTNTLNVHDGSTVGGNAITGGGGDVGMPAIVRAQPFGTAYAQLPDNISKFDGSSTRTPANLVLYVPCMFYTPTLITELGVGVGTADAASTDTRVGIFSQHATTGAPSTLVAGTGALDVSATGVRTETLGSPVTVHGFYWIGIKSDSTTLQIAHCNPGTSAVSLNPFGVSSGAGTMRFPTTTSVIGAFAADPSMDGQGTDNSSLWVPVYR